MLMLSAFHKIAHNMVAMTLTDSLCVAESVFASEYLPYTNIRQKSSSKIYFGCLACKVKVNAVLSIHNLCVS
jgi:phosphoribosylaminoimidazole (AIR) synthetase